MITPAQRIQNDAMWLQAIWAPLYASRLKGTPRPWKEPTLSPEQLAELDKQARAEKFAHGAIFGESPAPLHMDVLNLIIDITNTTRALAIRIAKETGDATTHTYLTRLSDPQPRDLLTYIHDKAAELDPTKPAAQYAIAQLSMLRLLTTGRFIEPIDGKHLKTDCPWCQQPTLFFRRIGPEHRPEFVVRCESGTCNPDYRDCGTWHHNHPCWPFQEWEWLAKRITHNERSTP